VTSDEIIAAINQLDETEAARLAKDITGQYLRCALFQLDMLAEAVAVAIGVSGAIIILVDGSDDAGVTYKSAARQDAADSARVVDTVRRLSNVIESNLPLIVEQQMAAESNEFQGD
jgi:hypothetical protein